MLKVVAICGCFYRFGNLTLFDYKKLKKFPRKKKNKLKN